MKTALATAVIVLALSFVSSTSAQCYKDKSSGDAATAQTPATKDGAACSATCNKKCESACAGKCDAACAAACKGGCPGQGVMATGMPLMKYKLGDQTLVCPRKAAEQAKASGATLRYVVGETEYADKLEALKAYETVLTTYLEQMTTVQFAVGDKCVGCPIAAQALARECGGQVNFRVASFTFTDRNEADKAAEAARAAVEKVTVKQIGDTKEAGCAGSAKRTCSGKSANDDGKKCEYQGGDMKTRCQTTASVELIKARIVAAHQAIAAVAGQPGERKEVAAGI